MHVFLGRRSKMPINKIVKVWGSTTSKNSFAAKEQKTTAARQRAFGVPSRAQRSDAGKKRK